MAVVDLADAMRLWEKIVGIASGFNLFLGIGKPIETNQLSFIAYADGSKCAEHKTDVFVGTKPSLEMRLTHSFLIASSFGNLCTLMLLPGIDELLQPNAQQYDGIV